MTQIQDPNQQQGAQQSTQNSESSNSYFSSGGFTVPSNNDLSDFGSFNINPLPLQAQQTLQAAAIKPIQPAPAPAIQVTEPIPVPVKTVSTQTVKLPQSIAPAPVVKPVQPAVSMNKLVKPVQPAVSMNKLVNPLKKVVPKTKTPTLPGNIVSSIKPDSKNKTALPAPLETNDPFAGSNFDIPKAVKVKYKDLALMVLATKSMDDKEKQYWFHILPIMSKKQVEKLEKILTTEKKKLESINSEFSQKLKNNQEEKIAKWKGEEAKKRSQELRAKEKTAEEQEKEAEEALLSQLNDI